MAEVPPNNPLPGAPAGASPMKKSTGKVQPKKETVRINLPPKPTAAPTIKPPTLPPGGSTGAPVPAPAPVAAAAPAPARAASAPAAPVASARTGAAPAAGSSASPRPAAAAPRPAAASAVPALKTLDKALIYTAAVASLVAVGGTVWVLLTLKNVVDSFLTS